MEKKTLSTALGFEPRSLVDNKIIFLCFKFFSWKIIFSLSNQSSNNNIAILKSKIIYFCLSSNFRGWTTLKSFFVKSLLCIIQRKSLNFQLVDKYNSKSGGWRNIWINNLNFIFTINISSYRSNTAVPRGNRSLPLKANTRIDFFPNLLCFGAAMRHFPSINGTPFRQRQMNVRKEKNKKEEGAREKPRMGCVAFFFRSRFLDIERKDKKKKKIKSKLRKEEE